MIDEDEYDFWLYVSLEQHGTAKSLALFLVNQNRPLYGCERQFLTEFINSPQKSFKVKSASKFKEKKMIRDLYIKREFRKLVDSGLTETKAIGKIAQEFSDADINIDQSTIRRVAKK